MLRLVHLYAEGEDAVLSQNVSIDLGNLFANLQPVSLLETSLTGNQPISEMNRLFWRTKSSNSNQDNKKGDGTINLSPLEIRTFLVRFENK